MKTKEEFEAKVAAMKARPAMHATHVESCKCPVCWREQQARVDENGAMTSSCVFCGYVFGKYENYEVREVMTRQGVTKFEVTAKCEFPNEG